MREGHGTFTWANGESYTGEFKNNQPNGQGEYSWPSGRKYTGQFRDGVIVEEDASALPSEPVSPIPDAAR